MTDTFTQGKTDHFILKLLETNRVNNSYMQKQGRKA